MSPAASEARGIGLAWLLRLRTASVFGVLALVLGVWGLLGVRLPLPTLLAIVAAWLATNVGAVLWGRSGRVVTDEGMALLLAIDALMLAAIFYFTGGPSNPFSFFFLVHLSLAAVALPSRYAWGVAALSALLFGLLFLDHVPLPHDMDGHGHHDMALHLQGMWVAFVLAAAYILTFTTRLGRALAEQQASLVEARAQAAKSERLASLATLAAGAAHELATPLSTIAIAAKELERELGARGLENDTLDDLRLVQEQVARCRHILDSLRVRAGDPGGEAPTPTRAGDLVARALEGLPQRGRVDVDVAADIAERSWNLYAASLAQALAGIVKNGLEASEPQSRVRVSARSEGSGLAVAVHDHGPGLPPDVAARIGEPFFTTKGTGRGMGLGVFLARTLVERTGGRLEIHSAPGTGTTITFHLLDEASA